MSSKQFRDPEVSADGLRNVPIEDVAGTSKDLVIQGEMLHYGLSEPGLQTVRRAHKEHPVAVVQNECSMLYRGPEAALHPVCQELGYRLRTLESAGHGFPRGPATLITALIVAVAHAAAA